MIATERHRGQNTCLTQKVTTPICHSGLHAKWPPYSLYSALIWPGAIVVVRYIGKRVTTHTHSLTHSSCSTRVILRDNIYLDLWRCQACTRTWMCPEQTSQCAAYWQTGLQHNAQAKTTTESDSPILEIRARWYSRYTYLQWTLCATVWLCVKSGMLLSLYVLYILS